MGATVRARVSRGGILKPLDRVDLPEWSEVTLSVIARSRGRNRADFLKAEGGWKGSGNAKKLIHNIYRSRLISTRPIPKL